MKIYLVIALLVAVEGVSASQETDAVRKALINRLERLQNVSIDYRLTENIKLSPGMEKEKLQKKGNYTIMLECGTLKFKNKFSYLKGKKRYDSAIESVSKDGQHHLPLGSSETMTYLEDHEEYLVQGMNPTPTGYIRSQLVLPYHSGIEVALGMRTYLRENWVTPAMIREGDLNFEDHGHAVLTWKDEKGSFHQWSFSPGLGYALTAYTILHSKTKNVMVEFVMSDFKSINGMMVPYRMVEKSRSLSTGEVFKEKQFEVTECRINDPANVPALYHIAWPPGTAVIEEGSKRIQIAMEDGQLIDARKMDDRTRAKLLALRNLKSKMESTKPSCSTQPTTQTQSTQKALN